MSETEVEKSIKQLSFELGVNLNDPKLAIELDKKDSLASFRDRFFIPKKKAFVEGSTDESDCFYFTGNSLGLQPKTVRKYINEELEEWADKGVEGHFSHSKQRPWLTYDENGLEHLSHIVGALKSEVVAMNSLSTNLHLMMVPFYQPSKERHKILIEHHAFPSDLYVVQSQIKYHGYDPLTSLIQLKPREGENILRTEDILKLIQEEGDSIALIMFGGVQYYTGQFLDISKITEAGLKKGCRMGWDLAHAVGNVILKLHDWNVDFACWCSYKYLNSGPGAVGGCFVHSKHDVDKDLPRFSAWWGHDLTTRFAMNEENFIPMPGAFGYRCSNAPVFNTAALLASLEIFGEATMPRLREKSILLTGYLELLLLHEIPEEVKILTPIDPQQRGCQLSLVFKRDVSEVSKVLQDNGVVCDVRKPHVLRVSPTPLYNKFHDVWSFVKILRDALKK